MKIYNPKIMLLAVGAIFLSSCTTFLYTSLDVLRPAKVNFALDATNLLMVNNTVIQPSNYGHKTNFLNEKEVNETVRTDSLALYCVSALNEELETKNFFSSVQLMPNSIHAGSEFLTSNRLPTDSVKNLCKATGASVILSLDNIKVNDDLTEYFIPERSSYLYSLEAKVETSWSVHYPTNSDTSSIRFRDTLYWESESYNKQEAITQLPKREDALIDAALETGRKSVNRFIPYWEKVDRYFCNPSNKLMKRGMDSVYVKNWKSAIEIWDIAFTKNKGTSIKGQAAHNIAVGYEIDGNIDKALEYALKAYHLFEKGRLFDYKACMITYNYIRELNARKKELEVLKKQVGE